MIGLAAALVLQVYQAPIIENGAELLRLCQSSNAVEVAVCEAYIQGASGAANDIADAGDTTAFCYPAGITIDEVRLALIWHIRANPSLMGSSPGGVVVAFLMSNYPCRAAFS